MISKSLLKEIVLEERRVLKKMNLGITREKLQEIKSLFKLPHVLVIAGVRRVGKSTLLRQIMETHYNNNFYYLNFEDERLLYFRSTDFNRLYEIFMELFDEQKTFFLDEIQNIVGWERFVRRMQEAGFKFFISGSNATLLSRELGTKLTGRHISTTLLPFSFREFLEMQHIEIPKKILITSQRAKIKKAFYTYLKEGGMPEYLTYKNPVILKDLYEDILYKDIMVRHDIKETQALRELALYYISNIGSSISFNKLKQVLQLGSTNTVKTYTDYFENSFLFFTVKHFSYSLKKQTIAAKKIYCIDNGLARHIAFSFSENKGAFLENMIFIELKRRGKEIFYYKTRNGLEIDFLTFSKGKISRAIQVCWDLQNEKTKQREINSLNKAMEELNLKRGLILTCEEEGKIRINKRTIEIIPAWKWLMLK